MNNPLTWQELEQLTNWKRDRVNGATNSQATLRLFGHQESEVRVTLYRDNHAWCPYCQKVWLWLEEKQVPYRIKKVTMFCYGTKEQWYKEIVPSGMLPAIAIDNQIITESDDILVALEREYGVLRYGMNDPQVIPLRRLERLLFRAWCSWLCYPSMFPGADKRNRSSFEEVVAMVEEALGNTPSPYFLDDFSTADLVFIPYVERMNASLYYYKGYTLRDNPGFAAWFDALETRSTYRGTQSDFHTHAHDLPPQMGGCYSNKSPQAKINQQKVDTGSWWELPDVKYPEPETSREEALQRVLKHRDNIIKANPSETELFDKALRCALTNMMQENNACIPPVGSDVGLRYLRDRINVPRDISIYAAKRLRTALEATAALVGEGQGEAISTRHRRDQNPLSFAS